jgi:hypothetical protein
MHDPASIVLHAEQGEVEWLITLVTNTTLSQVDALELPHASCFTTSNHAFPEGDSASAGLAVMLAAV